MSTLDEATIEEGFATAIEAAYSGHFSIDEYITLIQNIAYARSVGYSWPVEINMERLESGIRTCLCAIVKSDERSRDSLSYTPDEILESFTAEEKKLYKLIEVFRAQNIHMFAINKRLLLKSLSESSIDALYECENKRFNVFDTELAHAIAKCYRGLSNSDRRAFISWFSIILKKSIQAEDLQVAQAIEGFRELIKELDIIENAEIANSRKLKAALTIKFKEAVNDIIENPKTQQKESK